jgi:hypothetical protein
MLPPPNYHISCELDCTVAPLFGCACCKFGVETKRETRYVLKDCVVSMYDVVTNRQPAKLVCANITSGTNRPKQNICCFCTAECDWRWYAMQCIDPLATDHEPYLFYTCGTCSEFGLNEINDQHSIACPFLIRCADSCVLYEFDGMHRMDD